MGATSWGEDTCPLDHAQKISRLYNKCPPAQHLRYPTDRVSDGVTLRIAASVNVDVSQPVAWASRVTGDSGRAGLSATTAALCSLYIVIAHVNGTLGLCPCSPGRCRPAGGCFWNHSLVRVVVEECDPFHHGSSPHIPLHRMRTYLPT